MSRRQQVTRFTRLLQPSWTSGTTDLPPGGRKQWKLSQLPTRVQGGVVYLAGLVMYVTVQFDKVAATMDGTMAGELFYTVLRNIRLVSEGHAWLDGVDGLTIRRDTELRTGQYPEAMPGDESDADETNGTQAFIVQWHANNPSAPPSQRNDGAIPLDLFNSEVNPGNILELECAANLEGFAGVTVDGITSMEIYAVCEVHEELRIPSPHSLRQQPSVERNVWLEPKSPVEYLIMAARREDASGGAAYSFDHSSIANLKLWVGDQQVIDGRNANHIARAHSAERFGTAANMVGDGQAQAMSSTAPPYLPLLQQGVGEYRTKLPEGAIRVQYDSGTDYDTRGVLYQWREVGRHSADLLKRFARRMGIAEGQVPAEVRGAKPNKGGAASSILDLKVR